MKKKVNHVVKRPGHKIGDADVEIPIAADLVSVPGSPTREHDVSFIPENILLRVKQLKNQQIVYGRRLRIPKKFRITARLTQKPLSHW